jgi:hypothetical protein
VNDQTTTHTKVDAAPNLLAIQPDRGLALGRSAGPPSFHPSRNSYAHAHPLTQPLLVPINPSRTRRWMEDHLSERYGCYGRWVTSPSTSVGQHGMLDGLKDFVHNRLPTVATVSLAASSQMFRSHFADSGSESGTWHTASERKKRSGDCALCLHSSVFCVVAALVRFMPTQCVLLAIAVPVGVLPIHPPQWNANSPP